MNLRTLRAYAGGLLLAAAASATVPALAAGDGKLLLTSGVSCIDGPAGGGITPWAVTGSYATQGQWGASAFASTARTQDYGLTAWGAAVSAFDRVEASLARQDMDTRDNLAARGLPGLHLRQTIVGAKLRLAGDAVLDSDRWLPQLAVGVLHKHLDSSAFTPTLTGALGAGDSGTEFYLSATKLFIAPGLLVNLTLRLTDANQGGLLGFGGAQARGRRVQPEISLAYWLHRTVVAGVEARAKPDNLNRSALGNGALREDAWYDAFVAWAPNKTLSLTLAFVDVGHVAPALQARRQNGGYLSAQLAY